MRALTHRNYRLFFFGQSISLIGTWMQQVAMTWLVYRQTQSEWLLGIVSFSAQIPYLLFSPLAGVLSENCNRKYMLIATQSLAMLQALVLAFITYNKMLGVWQIIVLAVSLGIINAFDMPIRQAFLPDIVTSKKDLPNAVGLNTALANCARFIGPALSGLAIKFFGEDLCFFLNGLSYCAVVIALMNMRITSQAKTQVHQKFWQNLYEGFEYSYNTPAIRSILSLLALTSIAAVSLTTLLPIFAVKFFSGGAGSLGIMNSIAGVGAFLGAVYLSYHKTLGNLDKTIYIASCVLGIAMFIFTFAKHELLASFCLVLIGGSNIIQIAACATLLQVLAEETKRARVLGLYCLAVPGMAPLGSLLAGYMGSRIGVQMTVAIMSCTIVVNSFRFYRQVPACRQSI